MSKKPNILASQSWQSRWVKGEPTQIPIFRERIEGMLTVVTRQRGIEMIKEGKLEPRPELLAWFVANNIDIHSKQLEI